MTSAFNFDSAKHEFSVDGRIIPSVTQILSKVGVCDFSWLSREIRERSMSRGSSVHWMLQLEDEGSLNPRRIPIRLRGYRKAYLRWKAYSGFVPYREWIEKQFISPHGYAGIIDRIGEFPNRSVAIVDFKTGEIPFYVRYQLVAYAAYAEKFFVLGPMMRRIAISLRANGEYKVHEFPVRDWLSDWSVYIDFLRRAQQ